jgi:hypothetical protein
MDASSIKYGAGATREIGHDLGQWGARRVMVVTDPNLARTEPVSLVLDALRPTSLPVRDLYAIRDAARFNLPAQPARPQYWAGRAKASSSRNPYPRPGPTPGGTGWSRDGYDRPAQVGV